jgi:hypothetical protein
MKGYKNVSNNIKKSNMAKNAPCTSRNASSAFPLSEQNRKEQREKLIRKYAGNVKNPESPY